jgi:hypothetical protein
MLVEPNFEDLAIRKSYSNIASHDDHKLNKRSFRNKFMVLE